MKTKGKLDIDEIKELHDTSPEDYSSNEMGVQLAMLHAQNGLSKKWDIQQTLFQYEDYAFLIEILELDKVNPR